MKVCCYLCRTKAEGSEDKLNEEGWNGADGQINGIKFKFDLCPEHSGAKNLIEIMNLVKEGNRIYRKADGTYDERQLSEFEMAALKEGVKLMDGV